MNRAVGGLSGEWNSNVGNVQGLPRHWNVGAFAAGRDAAATIHHMTKNERMAASSPCGVCNGTGTDQCGVARSEARTHVA